MPYLKASQAFANLQSQLEGTENRIAVARKRYNAKVSANNQAVNGLMGKFINMFAHFQLKPYYEADAGAADAPVVSFDDGTKPEQPKKQHFQPNFK